MKAIAVGGCDTPLNPISSDGEKSEPHNEPKLLQKMTDEQLTEVINEEVNNAHGYEVHARRAGMALTILKRRMIHGQWESWLAEHFIGSPRSAQRYMELAAEPLVLKTKAVKTATAVSLFRKRKTSTTAERPKAAADVVPTEDNPKPKPYPDNGGDKAYADFLEHNAPYHKHQGLEAGTVRLLCGCKEIIKTVQNRFRFSANKGTALGIPSAQVYVDLAAQWDRDGFDLIRELLKPEDIELLKQSREILDQLIAPIQTAIVTKEEQRAA